MLGLTPGGSFCVAGLMWGLEAEPCPSLPGLCGVSHPSESRIGARPKARRWDVHLQSPASWSPSLPRGDVPAGPELLQGGSHGTTTRNLVQNELKDSQTAKPEGFRAGCAVKTDPSLQSAHTRAQKPAFPTVSTLP